MSVIIPELLLLEVEGEASWGDAMVFDQSLLGVAPESLQSVDVYTPLGKLFSVIDSQMPVAAEHKGVVDLKAVGVDDTASPHLFDGQIHDRLSSDIGHDLYPDAAISLQDTEDGDFFARPSPPHAFLASRAEVGFVEFHFAPQKDISILGVGQDGYPDRVDRLIGRVVGQPRLLSDLTSRYLQLEQFDNPEPLEARQRASAEQAAGEVMKGVSAS